MTSWWRRIPHTPAWIVVWGVLLVVPTLGAGLVMDDVLMRMKLLGAETAWGAAPWWDLYTFARADLNAGLRDAGFHPWWSDLQTQMVFFRPLSALTHVVDYALWPNLPVLHHLHSVLWYAGVLVVRRVDADTLEITAAEGFMARDLDMIHRRDVDGFAVGDVVPLPDLDVEIVALTDDGRPARAAFRFHVPLEDPSLRWMFMDAPGGPSFPPRPVTAPLVLPAIGETVEIPSPM